MSVPTDQQILDAIKTAIFEIATNGAAAWAVNGRTFTALDLDKLQKAEAFYAARVGRSTYKMFAPISINPMR